VKEDKWDPFFTTRLLQQCDMNGANQSSSEYFIRLIDLIKIEPIFECHHMITMICQNCNKQTQKKDTSYNPLINDSLDELFEFNESIEGFKCDGCNQKTTLVQHKKLSGLSPILVLSLNKYFGKKMIEYPSTFKVDNASYRLIGTVEHTGSLQGGHYISRFDRNKHTYLADDSRIMEIQDNIIKPVIETYMIFYERFE
jgi:ubiquitin C-terminal hydrolase